jgi:hypothetical protein
MISALEGTNQGDNQCPLSTQPLEMKAGEQ